MVDNVLHYCLCVRHSSLLLMFITLYIPWTECIMSLMNTLEREQQWRKRPRKLQEKRLKLYGHVMRVKEEHLLIMMLNADIPGNRK